MLLRLKEFESSKTIFRLKKLKDRLANTIEKCLMLEELGHIQIALRWKQIVDPALFKQG